MTKQIKSVLIQL